MSKIEKAHPELNFMPSSVVETSGGAWHIASSRMDKGWGNGETLDRTVAIAPDGESLIAFEAATVSEKGEIEEFRLRYITPEDINGQQNYPVDKVPEEVVGALKGLAEKEFLFCGAGLDANGGCHQLTVDGQRWMVGIPHAQGNDDAAIAQAWSLNPAAGRQRFVSVMPRALDDNKITEYDVFTLLHGDKEWQKASEVPGEVPQRLVDEVLRYANFNKCFGHLAAGYNAGLDESVAAQTENMDAQLAKLLGDHHRQRLDDSLENGQWDEAAKAVTNVKSHREAERALGLPRSHAERIEFERRQSEAIGANGDDKRFQR